MNCAVKSLGAMHLRKVFNFLLFSTFLFASCQKDKEGAPSPKQTGFQANDKGVFRSLVWQISDSLLRYIQPPSGLNVTDYAPWLNNNVKVEIHQDGTNIILSLPYVLFNDRHQAPPNIFYSIRNDQAVYPPEWRTGPIIILGKQNGAIDFTKKADVRITRFF